MYKIKVVPHTENRYLYNVVIYERNKCFGFKYWRFWCANEAIPDWCILDYIKQFIHEKSNVIHIDFRLQEYVQL